MLIENLQDMVIRLQEADAAEPAKDAGSILIKLENFALNLTIISAITTSDLNEEAWKRMSDVAGFPMSGEILESSLGAFLDISGGSALTQEQISDMNAVATETLAQLKPAGGGPRPS